jgi:PAS domain S-box-containing protein
MALWTAASFFFLGLGLFAGSRAAAAPGLALPPESASNPTRQAPGSTWAPLAVSGLLALAIAITGALYLRDGQAAARATARNELRAIADLKVAQIVNWRNERMGDARFFSRAAFVARDVRSFFIDPSSERARSDILNWLTLVKADHRYEQVALFDTNLTLRLAVSDQTDSVADVPRELLAVSLRDSRVIMSDLCRGASDNDIHLDLILPVIEPASEEGLNARPSTANHRPPLGVLLLRIDPSRFLYKLIQSWPIPSPSAETLLARREGAEVVFLNELRHLSGTALSMRMPIDSASRLPAAMAVSGREDQVEGMDYRGVQVLAAIGPVPGSPWFIVSKVDLDEIYAPIRRQAWLTLMLTAVLAAMAGLAVKLFWRGRETAFVEQERAAERQRLALAERIAMLMKQANDIILLLDVDWRIIEANDRAVETYGYNEDELREMGLRDLRAPVARALFDEEMRKVDLLEGGILETVHQRKDGSTFPVECSLRTSEIDGRSFHQIILRDITERKRAEEKLRQQLARMNLLNRITCSIAERQDLRSVFGVVLRHLEDDLPIDFGCICFYDSISRVLLVAASSSKPPALAGELDMGPGGVIPVDQNGLGACVRGQTVHDPDTTLVDAPALKKLARGGLRSLAAMPLMVENKVLGVLMAARRGKAAFSSGECEFLRQLSEHVALAVTQMELHESLQKAYEDLRETQQAVMQQERLRAMGQMASGIAHDINNALGPISLYVESLLESEPDLSARARRQLETVQAASDDIADTVARMREFYSKREEQMALLPLDLNSLARQVIDLSRPRWKDMPQQRGVVIDVQFDLQDDLPAVMGVESEIRGALTNLVFNAVDAMAGGGCLTMRTRAEGSSVLLDVTDTGAGMDEEMKRRCLEPFYSTKGERGTGLGLAMVYGVAQRHDAGIAIESRPGKGTTMRLVFPVPSDAGVASPVAAAVPRAAGPLHILCIDDDALVRRSLQETLDREGHRVQAAEAGREGLDAFRAAAARGEPFDIVITDLGMPHMDGREVARAIKHDSPATPVILLTGWGMHMNAEGEKPAHVDRVISKPPKMKDLRLALEDLAGPGRQKNSPQAG